jgi:hypothetical protein
LARLLLQGGRLLLLLLEKQLKQLCRLLLKNTQQLLLPWLV